LESSDLFSVRRVDVNGEPRLCLVGEVDAYTVPALRQAITEALADEGHPLVLDCAELAFIDGSGLRVIEWSAVVFAPRRVELHGASPILRQLAAITGLDRRVDFVPALPAAMETAPAQLRAV